MVLKCEDINNKTANSYLSKTCYKSVQLTVKAIVLIQLYMLYRDSSLPWQHGYTIHITHLV